MVYRLSNKVQNYAWGGQTFIPELLGLDNEAKQPFAEIWMGTHHRGESEILFDGEMTTLSEYIASAPDQILGAVTAQKFRQELPYLFKVLDVQKMLSIQVHPTKLVAERGFADENKRGVPISAKRRNFRDDNHKPEVMIALTEFWLLHGFKSAEAIDAILEEVPEFHFLKKSFEEKSIFKLYKTIMELPSMRVNEYLMPLKIRLEKGNWDKSHPNYWAKLGFEQHTFNGNLDKGIFSIYLYNLVHLQKGEGIYQAANIPHAYLEGVNIELMASSDNVLRGGLTYKHVDVPELLRNLFFESVTPAILKGKVVGNYELVFPTEAPDFEVSMICLPKEKIYKKQNNQSPETIILLQGKVKINHETYIKGESCFIPVGTDYQIEAIETAELYKAYVPV